MTTKVRKTVFPIKWGVLLVTVLQKHSGYKVLDLQFQCFQKLTFKFGENYNGFEEQQLCGRTFLANDGMTIELTTPRPL